MVNEDTLNEEARYTRKEILRFLDGPTTEWDWGDFISTPLKTPYLNAIRIICRDLPDFFLPPKGSQFYCSDEGYALLRILAERFVPVK